MRRPWRQVAGNNRTTAPAVGLLFPASLPGFPALAGSLERGNRISSTPAPVTECRLCEPDGTLVSRGRVQRLLAGAGNDVVITGIDNPGRLISRCLTGPVRQVILQLGNGPLRRAVIQSVRFDPKLGRICVLRLATDSATAA